MAHGQNAIFIYIYDLYVILIIIHVVVGYGWRYGRLSSQTFHCSVRNTAAQNDRFYKAANVGNCTDVVDTRYGGYASLSHRTVWLVSFR